MVTDVRPSAGADSPGDEWRPDGPGAGEDILSLARRDPGAALSILRDIFGAWDDDRLAGLAAGRQEITCALGEIARKPENFEEAARMLLRLAATKCESALNGARSTFARLFANVLPSMASTRAGADKRATLLAELLDDGDKRIRLLALSACDTALKTCNFTQVDCESGRPTTHLGWAIVGKEFDAYRRVLALLTGKLDRMAPDEREVAAQIILKRSVDLSRHREMSCEAAAAVKKLHEGRLVDKEQLVQTTKMIVGTCACKAGKKAEAAWGSLLADVLGSAGRAAPDEPPGRAGRQAAGHVPDAVWESEDGKVGGQNGRGAGRGRSR